MAPSITAVTHDLSEQEQTRFLMEFTTEQKDPTTGLLLALFLGGLGAHRFYLGPTRAAVIFVVALWLGSTILLTVINPVLFLLVPAIPGLVGLVETFFLPNRVRMYNTALARDIVARLHNARGLQS